MTVDIAQMPGGEGIREHEQEMWKSFIEKIKEAYLEGDAIVTGSVDLEGFEVDCILITNNCLCVIDFKAYVGEIELRDGNGDRLEQFSTNARWYLIGSSTEVKGGRQGTPYDQIQNSKWELKKRIEAPNGEVPLIDLGDFTNPSGVVLFNGDTFFPYKIPETKQVSMHKWFHVTNMDKVIECIKTIEQKARLGLTYDEMQAISKQILYGEDDAWKKCKRRTFKTPKKRSTSKTPRQTSKSSAQPRAGTSKSPTRSEPMPAVRRTLGRSFKFLGRFVIVSLFVILGVMVVLNMGGDNEEEQGVSPSPAAEPAQAGRMPRSYQEHEARQYDESVLAGEMVLVPGGAFRMGDLSGAGKDNERPAHDVTVPSFRIGKHEVTFAQWDACVEGGGCRSYRPHDEGWGRDNRPVIHVSWNDVQSFIGWLNRNTAGGYRLPTEAEWEYAARADGATIYSWGNNIVGNKANCDGCRNRWDGHRTAPVGSFAANAWGLHDMPGNVFEWVEDCWHRNYQGAPANGSEWRSDCDDDGYYSRRVIRGGSWYSYEQDLRSASRYGTSPTVRRSDLGFRLARDIQGSGPGT